MAARSPDRPAAGAAAHEVRIVGGSLRRSRLPVPDRPGLRPTPDRVRETLFNWLGQDLHGWRVLDAFAGSGALGFEAASRGAARVLLLERDAGVARSLRDSRERLKVPSVEVVTAEALAWMRRAAPAQFDLVLLDPPFDAGLLPAALAAAAPLADRDGLLYVECGAALAAADVPAGWSIRRQGRAGQVHYHLLQRSTGAVGDDPTAAAGPAAPHRQDLPTSTRPPEEDR